MKCLFILCLTLVLGYTIFRYRRFDYFTIAAFSSLIYYYPGIIGYISDSQYTNAKTDISDKLYVCLCTYLIILFIFMMLTDRATITIGETVLYRPINMTVSDISTNGVTNFSVLIVEFLGVALLIKVHMSYEVLGTNFNKMKLLAEANRYTEYMKYISLFTFVYSFINIGSFIKVCRAISLVLIGYTFLLGHRSFAVIGIITIFMHYVGSKEKTYFWKVIKKHWILFLGMFLAAFFFLFVKNVFAALMSGQFDIVKQRLGDPEYYVKSMLNSEANAIISNLNNVVVHQVKYSFLDYLMGFILLIPIFGGPIANWFGYEGFEHKLNVLFNKRLDQGIGLGSTYLGEAYSMGGIFAVALVSFLTFCFLLFLISRRDGTKSNLAYTFFGIVLSYFTFYIHRNSLIFLLITARAYLYIWLLTWIIEHFISMIVKRK